MNGDFVAVNPHGKRAMRGNDSNIHSALPLLALPLFLEKLLRDLSSYIFSRSLELRLYTHVKVGDISTLIIHQTDTLI